MLYSITAKKKGERAARASNTATRPNHRAGISGAAAVSILPDTVTRRDSLQEISAVLYCGKVTAMPRKNSAKDRTISSHGYVLLWMPEHHLADARGYVYEHRIVAENKIGRRLERGEIVHHIDGNKQNNAPENIEIVHSIAHHRRQHRQANSQQRNPGEANETISCACGCGQTLQKFDKLGRPRRFVSGHNMKGNSNG